MSRVFFIRHAETEMAGRFCGHSDPGLNARGREQLRDLVQLLSDESIDQVYSSDLRRARSTAEAIAAKRVLLRPALREIDFGRWEGLSWQQVEQADPEYAREWIAAFPHLPAPAGESFHAFETRILAELNQLLGENRGPIAVVTHAGVLRVVLRHLFSCSNQEAWQQTRSYCCVMPYESCERGANK